MFDTLAVITYLLGRDPKDIDRLHLKASFPDKPPVTCVQNAPSPQIKWQKVSPDASSLALIVKDSSHYEWVVYNLPIDARGLPFDANAEINPNDVGINSWGQKNYHSPCVGNTKYPVTVELFVLDKRFSARNKMTGEMLEKKIKDHVMEKAIVRE